MCLVTAKRRPTGDVRKIIAEPDAGRGVSFAARARRIVLGGGQSNDEWIHAAWVTFVFLGVLRAAGGRFVHDPYLSATMHCDRRRLPPSAPRWSSEQVVQRQTEAAAALPAARPLACRGRSTKSGTALTRTPLTLPTVLVPRAYSDSSSSSPASCSALGAAARAARRAGRTAAGRLFALLLLAAGQLTTPPASCTSSQASTPSTPLARVGPLLAVALEREVGLLVLLGERRRALVALAA